MIGWLVRATVTTLVTGILGYFIVAIPVGRRTLLEHCLEIYRTEPAQELASDVGEAAQTAYDRLRKAVDKP